MRRRGRGRGHVVEHLRVQRPARAVGDHHGPAPELRGIESLAGIDPPARTADPEAHLGHHLSVVHPAVDDGLAGHPADLAEVVHVVHGVRQGHDVVDRLAVADRVGELGSHYRIPGDLRERRAGGGSGARRTRREE